MTNWSSDNKQNKRRVNRNASDYLRLHESGRQDHGAWPLFSAMSDLDDDLLRDVKPAGTAPTAANVSEKKRASKGKPSFWNRYRKSFAAAACLIVAVGMVMILRQSGLLKGFADRSGEKAIHHHYDAPEQAENDLIDNQEFNHSDFTEGSFNNAKSEGEISPYASNFGDKPGSQEPAFSASHGHDVDNSGQDLNSDKNPYRPFYASPHFEDSIALWFDENALSESANQVKDSFSDPKDAAKYPRLMLMLMDRLPDNTPRLTLDDVKTIVQTFDQNRRSGMTTTAFQSEMARCFNKIAGAPDRLICGADQQMTYFLKRVNGVNDNYEEQQESAVESALQAMRDKTRPYIRVEGLTIWYSAEGDEGEMLLYTYNPDVP
ncbi:MAG: hypothetical protein GX939_00350 [Clostridiaceae bacterium]|jgi:hypothetical protein|nr:hypothetical protein [Clostridiaceae bacterium]